jgi:hypothetical protein
MNPLALLIGAAAVGGLALAMKSEKKQTPAGTPATGSQPSAAPPGGFPIPSTIDVSKILTQVFNDASGQLTPDQLERIKVVFQNLGTNGDGKLTTQPAIWAKEAALALADELDAEGVPAGVGGTIRTVVLGAMALPASPPSYENPTVSGSWEHGPWQNVQGPWNYLGSLTEQNRKTEPSLPPGSYTDISGFTDWWESFTRRWAESWNRGPYRR